MNNATLFDRIEELKEKFCNFFQHRKKLKALENYSTVVPFHHKKYLYLIKNCMDDGFLEQKEAEFLDYMLTKYEVNYLDWSHRTKWLKGEMHKLAEKHFKPKEEFFLFSKPVQKPTYAVPMELFLQPSNQTTSRRI